MDDHHELQSVLQITRRPALHEATLVLAFSGWMDGGDVSTGTVSRLVQLTGAEPFASIDPDPFYIYNFPGPMEIAALFRPPVEIHRGVTRKIEFPSNTFYCREQTNVALFIGKEPNLRWKLFGDSILRLAADVGVRRILFVGSYGGSVPHTREPHLYVTCSDKHLVKEMTKYGVERTGYEGPGSFTSYLMTRAPQADLEMISLVVEIPSYLQGPNVSCIEAATRRLAKILKLPLDLDSLRAASTIWEMEVSQQVEQDESLSEQIRELERAYDDQLLEDNPDEQ